jgi:hypothetical protein
MSEPRGALLPTLDRLFAGPRESVLTLGEFLDGLETRSYALAIAALGVINVVPNGIPWLSTITGVPMFLLAIQCVLGRPSPSLPAFIARHGLSRGKLQDFLARARGRIERLESIVRPRHDWWVRGTPRRLMLGAWILLIILLALPVPFDNMLPALAILFFCLAMLEGDGMMAIVGWFFTVVTVIWTIFLMTVGHLLISQLLKAIF